MKTNAQLQKELRFRRKHGLVKLYIPKHLVKPLTKIMLTLDSDMDKELVKFLREQSK